MPSFIKGMRFRKKLFGGVDEADVWQKLEMLHKEYEAVFLAQEIRREEAEKPRREGTDPA